MRSPASLIPAIAFGAGTMTHPKPNSLVHIEFASDDPGRTRKFLEDVFSWKFESIPGLEYYPFSTTGGPGGAVMPRSEERPRGVLNYLLSEDIERDARKIEAAGGRVVSPKAEIPGVGWWLLFEEPGHCVLALFETKSNDRGPLTRYRSDGP
jgi:uncharacterized protein